MSDFWCVTYTGRSATLRRVRLVAAFEVATQAEAMQRGQVVLNQQANGQCAQGINNVTAAYVNRLLSVENRMSRLRFLFEAMVRIAANENI